jgi:hypothetical protein
MNIVFENWYVIVLILAVITLAVLYVRKFYGMPTEEQVSKIKEWLLYAVILAEKEFKNGTGALKLRYVWNLFVEKYPAVARVITFEMFSLWVDEALEQMKHLLATNKDIACYVEGE